MHNELQKWYGEYERMFTQTHALLTRLEKDVKQERSLTELADMSYVLREFSKLSDELRKKSEGLKGFVDRILCLLWAADLDNAEPIKTEYCTVTPKTEVGVRLPARNSEEHVKLLEALGINATDPEVVKLSFKEVSRIVTELQSQGLPMPEGLTMGESFDKFGTIIRARKGITE